MVYDHGQKENLTIDRGQPIPVIDYSVTLKIKCCLWIENLEYKKSWEFLMGTSQVYVLVLLLG